MTPQFLLAARFWGTSMDNLVSSTCDRPEAIVFSHSCKTKESSDGLH